MSGVPFDIACVIEVDKANKEWANEAEKES